MQSCRRLVEASDTVYGVVWAYIRHWRIHLRAGSTGHHGLSLLFPEWPADTGLSLIPSDAAKATAGTGGAGRFGSASSSPSSHRWVRFGQRGTWGKTHGRGQYPLGVLQITRRTVLQLFWWITVAWNGLRSGRAGDGVTGHQSLGYFAAFSL